MLFLNEEDEKRVFETQDDDPRWLIWAQRVVYYSIVWGSLAAFVIGGAWLTRLAFERWA